MLRAPCAAVVTAAALLFVIAGGEAAQQLTAGAVVGRHLAARGYNRWRNIATLRLTGTVTSGGRTVPIVVLRKRPYLMRQETRFESGTIVIAFDGRQAWTIDPFLGAGTAERLTGRQAADVWDQADFDGPLVNYRTKGHQISFVGDERLDGRLIHRLRVRKKNGRVQEFLIDAATNLELRTITTVVRDGETLTLEADFEDYRSIDGVMVAHRIRTIVAGQLASELAVEKVEFDVPIAADAFSSAQSPSRPGMAPIRHLESTVRPWTPSHLKASPSSTTPIVTVPPCSSWPNRISSVSLSRTSV